MREILVLLSLWGLAILMLVWKVPKNKRRDAQIVLLFSQSIGWLFVYIQTLLGRMKFPFREFPDATKMSFTLYYLFYPAIGVLFILGYPKKGFWHKFLYFSLTAFGIQLSAWLLAEYTDLMEYTRYSWLLTFAVNFMILVIIRIFYVWFQKGFTYERG